MCIPWCADLDYLWGLLQTKREQVKTPVFSAKFYSLRALLLFSIEFSTAFLFEFSIPKTLTKTRYKFTYS